MARTGKYYLGDRFIILQEDGKATATRSALDWTATGVEFRDPVQYTSLFDAMTAASIDGDPQFRRELGR